MAEENAATENQAPQQPPLVLNNQYIKDLSFESPNSPMSFAELAQGGQPDIPITVDTKARRLQENGNIFEVALHFNIESKLNDKVLFMLELAYGAMVTINAPKEHVEPLLLVETPRLIFPFARQVIADSTKDGGFPPLMLQPLDFWSLYQQRVQQAQEQAKQQEAAKEAAPASDSVN